MKKTFLLAFILTCCTIAFSQKVQFGIKGGLNVSKLAVDNVDEDDIESRIGFHIGGLAHIHLNRNWAIQPELVYSSQGMTQQLAGEEFEWKINYVNIPVMVQYMFEGGFRVQAGPQLGILTSAEIEDTDIDDNLNKIDFSLGFGFGYKSSSGFGVDARYNLGLSNINDNGSNDIMNRVLQVGVFYQFKK